MPSKSRFVVLILVIGLALVALPHTARSESHPNSQRGFSAESMAIGDLDSVNLFNGNLVVDIPLGQEYVVSPNLSYRFHLVYNSNVWDHIQVYCADDYYYPRAVPHQLSNAGLGWTLTLGHLLRHEDVVNSSGARLAAYIYAAPDGSEHEFFATRQGEDPYDYSGVGVFYTRDGSFLRLRRDGAAFEIDFPSGQVHRFEVRSNVNGVALTEMRDPFQNWVRLAYDDGGTTITVTDSASPDRNHVIRSEAVWDPANSADASRRRVTALDLARFGSSNKASYLLAYNEAVDTVLDEPNRRSCSDTSTDPDRLPYDQLIAVTLPDGTSYSMSTYPSSGQEPDGRLGWLMLPLGGQVSWTYRLYSLPIGSCRWIDGPMALKPRNPASCPSGGIVGPQIVQKRTQSWGVATRTVQSAGGTAQWTYVPELIAEPLSSDPEKKIFVAAKRRVFQHDTGVLTDNYFSAFTGYMQDDTIQNSVTTLSGAGYVESFAKDYGLPFWRSASRTDGKYPDDLAREAARAFLSSKVYQCGANASPPDFAGCGEDKLLRSTWLAYDQDALPNIWDALDSLVAHTNRRVTSRKAFFDDDTFPAYAVEGFSGWDGYGHLRKSEYQDNFVSNLQRTEITEWDANPAAWLLDRYTRRKRVQGSSQEIEEFQFAAAKPFLECVRKRQNSASRSASDSLVVYTQGSGGQVAGEKWYGGDALLGEPAHGAPTGSLCGPTDTPRYEFQHSYAFGVRSATTAPGEGNLKLLDLTIDPYTGLPSASRDAAGIETTLTFDEMGRAKTSTLGEAREVITYSLRPPIPSVTRTLSDSVAPLEKEQWEFDGFGRVRRHSLWGPAGGPEVVTMSYDSLGRKILESDRGSGNGTTFGPFDPFGRPTAIVKADGAKTELIYKGNRFVQRNTRVWNGMTSELVATKEWYDGLGRLTEIAEPALPNATDPKKPIHTRTRYSYDVAGRLVMVRHNAGEISPAPIRSFRYDGRGFLVREVHPENGATHYWYDAKGNVVKKVDAEGVAVRSTYDAAGRLREVWTPQARLREFEYCPQGATTGCDGATAGGRLIRSVGHNWRFDGGVCKDMRVGHDRLYDSLGRVQEKTTGVDVFVGGARETTIGSWPQSYQYDTAGRRKKACFAGTCEGSADSLSTTYEYGRPSAVSETANGQTFAFASDISYLPSGLVGSITHGNGVQYFQTADRGMARPGSIGARNGSVWPWPVETYHYDPSSNVVSTNTALPGSTKSYAYDVRSRVTSATVPGDLYPQKQTYVYDELGNLQSVATGDAADADRPTIAMTTSATTNQLSPDIGAVYSKAGSLLRYGLWEFTWDPLQQAKTVANLSEAWVHTYDADGERVWSWRSAGARVDTFALRGPDGKVLRDIRREGGTDTWEDYAYREGQLLGALKADGAGNRTPLYFDVDHLGSVRLITGAGGLVLSLHSFWPYGYEYTAQSEGEQMKFTGHERDLFGTAGSLPGEDDLDYLHARYYRPILGRFLSVDPSQQNPKLGDPQTWNRYAYARGNPLKYIDPNGKETFSIYRTLGGGPAKSPFNPISHTFVATTLGGLHTYSWGNTPDGKTQGRWFLDRPEDLSAAREALATGKASKRGDDSLDRYVGKAFAEVYDNPNDRSNHPNLLIAYNCKFESIVLLERAHELKAAEQKNKQQEEPLPRKQHQEQGDKQPE